MRVSLAQKSIDLYTDDLMNTQRIQNLREREARLNKRYEHYFAGQPRHSRNPSLLDEMLVEAKAIVDDAKKIDDETCIKLAESMSKQAVLYQNEAHQIRQIQASSAEVFLSHEYRSWTRIVFDRYERNFAGQSRASRDAGLLAGMVNHLERLDEELAKLEGRADDDGICADTRSRIQSNLKLYRSERQQITSTRLSGDLDTRANMLASAANIQFEQYRAHYAGKKRLSRSIPRLENIIAELEGTLDQMRALIPQGFANESNDQNIEIVSGRLDVYRKELTEIQKARGQATFSEFISELGRAANEIFDRYRASYAGQKRETRNLKELVDLTEGLYDLAEEMNRLDRVRDDENNQHNLAVVLDQLRLYHREYVEIGKAQKRS